jgi:hypothetical protein
MFHVLGSTLKRMVNIKFSTNKYFKEKERFIEVHRKLRLIESNKVDDISLYNLLESVYGKLV